MEFATKHCKPEDRARMLLGHFKVGSHKEYSASESAGLISDNSEGAGETRVLGPLVDFTGPIGNSMMKNVSAFGAPTAIVIVESIDLSMFCTSLGSYDGNRHRRIIAGDPSVGYPANSEVTAFIVLDVDKLSKALRMASDYFANTKTNWRYSPVIYVDRVRNIPSEKFTGVSNHDYMERIRLQAITKPPRFSLEEEGRFLMDPLVAIKTPKNMFTISMPMNIKEAFITAIVDKGSDQPQ